MHGQAPEIFFIMFGVPAICWAASDMFRRWLKHKENMTDALSAQTAERAAQYAARSDRVEQRVAVLERILTDRSTRLGEEIDRLRDAPIN